MLTIAAVAVNVHRVIEGHGGAVGFAVAYAGLRLFLIGLYVRARQHVSGAGRKLANVYIAGYSATTALWLVSGFLPSPLRYVLWGVAMVIDLAIPTRAWAVLGRASVVVSHLTERFETFFIIVLALWWIYFDLADTSVVGRGALGLIYVYAHFPLLAGVAAFGDGTKLAISEAARPALTAGARWALAGGIGAFALSLAVIHLGAEWTSLRDRTFISRIGLSLVGLALAAGGGAIAPWAFVALVAAAVVGQLLLEAVTPRGGAATVWEP
jgi:low temperature requirement protein LtrA